MKPRPTQVQHYFSAGSEIAGLLEKARDSLRVTGQVRKLLPDELAGRLSAAIRDGDRLVLLAESPVWAARIRFSVPNLRLKLPGVRDIRVRAVPPESASSARQPPRKPPPPSAESAEQIKIIANGVTDPELRQALMRLAAHGKK